MKRRSATRPGPRRAVFWGWLVCALFSLSVIAAVLAFEVTVFWPTVLQDTVDESPKRAASPVLVTSDAVLQQFIAEIRTHRHENRAVYERYLPVLGAKGVVAGLEAAFPKCHSEAHEFGRVLFAHVGDIGKSLHQCQDVCGSGCMHGVLMESFAGAVQDGHHLDLQTVRHLIKDFCGDHPVMRAVYSPGDCAHGVGHALMHLSGYKIPQALDACAQIGGQTLEYYCATGAYMQYVMERDELDARTRSPLYPCDTYAYPSACARYKMTGVVRRHYQAGRPLADVRTLCESLKESHRLGCYHGLGNAHVPYIVNRLVNIRNVCLGLRDEETFLCIEGAIERMAKFHEPRAWQVCKDLQGLNRRTCQTAVRNKMYSMSKDLSLYIGGQT